MTQNPEAIMAKTDILDDVFTNLRIMILQGKKLYKQSKNKNNKPGRLSEIYIRDKRLTHFI